VIIDVAACVGAYPFRELPTTSPDALLRQMDAVAIAEAWVGYLPSFLYRDPAPGNARLSKMLAVHADRLRPVPAIHPGLPNWEDDLVAAKESGAAAIRVYPNYQSLAPAGLEMTALVETAASLAVPVLLTVKFEDVRQRHPLDGAGDLPPAAVRALARCDPNVKLLVTHADRAFIEEVHFGLTDREAARVLWDISWVWGPPLHDLRTLVGTIGARRFAYGSGLPLRIAEATPAKLDLSGLAGSDRRAIERESLRAWLEERA
jgi:hypothetical protein